MDNDFILGINALLQYQLFKKMNIPDMQNLKVKEKSIDEIVKIIKDFQYN